MREAGKLAAHNVSVPLSEHESQLIGRTADLYHHLLLCKELGLSVSAEQISAEDFDLVGSYHWGVQEGKEEKRGRKT